jgi:hypothetical protein
MREGTERENRLLLDVLHGAVSLRDLWHMLTDDEHRWIERQYAAWLAAMRAHLTGLQTSRSGSYVRLGR